jgi:2-phospho-L-lactate/phosphoenolpyruvate guanylyltransferase
VTVPIRSRVIIPHRGLEAAKTRLAPILDPGERVALARDLLRRVLGVAREACGDVVVISPSAQLAEIVEAASARLVVQRGMGLNTGLDEARANAVAEGVGTLIVLHGDLPNLQPDDVGALAGELGDRPAAVGIAPDRAESGTNGLALRPPGVMGFHFGAGSLAAHVEAARVAGVEPAIVRRPGLAFDLDTPEDLARWLELGDAA